MLAVPTSSMGSPGFEAELEDEWLATFLREPRPTVEPVDSQKSFNLVLAKHDSMYQTYLKIGRQINGFKRCYVNPRWHLS